MPSTSAPGTAIIRLFALLVPAALRTRWIAEWTAELVHAWDIGRRQGDAPGRLRTRLVLRACGSVVDALWLRLHRGLSGAAFGAAAQDARLAARVFARRPGFATLFIATTAIGIGASTAIFSVVDAALLRPAPYAEPERLAILRGVSRSGTLFSHVPEDFAEQWLTQRQLFGQVEVHHARAATMSGGADPRHVLLAMTTPGLLRLLGARPVLGRLFTPDDSAPGAPPVALLSHELWRRDFGGRRDVIGTSVSMDGVSHIVIGVLHERFADPVERTSLWTAWAGPGARRLPGGAGVAVVVRTHDGLSRDALQRELDAVASRWNQEMPRPREAPWNVRPRYLDQGTVTPEGRQVVWVLGAAAACLLLIVCANAANLLLVRGNGRVLELATRQAIGATRSRIVRQLLTETLVLTVTGAAVGVAVASAGIVALEQSMPAELRSFLLGPLSMDHRVLAFAVAITLLVLLACGLSPAIALSRLGALQVGGARSMSASRRHVLARRVIVTAQLGLSALLLGGTALLVKTLSQLSRVDLGMETRDVLALELYLTTARYPEKGARDVFFDALIERLRRIDGVSGISVASSVPPGAAFHFQTSIQAEGSVPLAGQPSMLPDISADTAFFNVLRIPIVQGRAFSALDRVGTDPVAIIDEGLARQLWPSGSAVGRRFRVSEGSPWLTVVGVAGDVRARGPDDRGAPYEMYTPQLQQGGGASYRTIAIRGNAPLARLIGPVRSAVRAIDPAQPIEALEPLQDRFVTVLSQPRFMVHLGGLFGAAAVLLSAIGTFGVLSYAVSQRTREIGIRMALGARREEVMVATFREGLVLAIIGVGSGLAGILAAGRLVEPLLFDVSARDPLMLGGAALTVLIASVLATIVPAVRASRVSPLVAISVE